MSGARSRSKGRRGEQEIVALAQEHGLEAVRTWHTAQDTDAATRRCDVKIAGRPCQVKRAAAGFSKLYDGLSNVELLFLRADGREWLVCLNAERLLKMLRGKKRDCGTRAVIPRGLEARGRDCRARIESRVVAIMQSDDENK